VAALMNTERESATSPMIFIPADGEKCQMRSTATKSRHASLAGSRQHRKNMPPPNPVT